MITNIISGGYALRIGVMILVILLLAGNAATATPILDTSIRSNELNAALHVRLGNAAHTSTVSGNYTYVGQSRDFSVIDIRSLVAPLEVGRVTISGNIFNIRVENNFAYITDDVNRIITIDISNPLVPREIKKIDTKSSTIQQQGWPIDTGSVYMTAPVLADFDPEYEGIETIVAAGGDTYVWHKDGTPMVNWNPLKLGQTVPIHSPPAVGDIDKDGSLDMVLVTYSNSTEPPKVWVLNRNGTIQPNWPKSVGDEITSAPVLADLDNDGYLEILVSSKDGNLYIWRHDGSNLNAAWPKQTNRTLYHSPVVGNLDDDKELEIVLATGEIGSVNNYVYIWNLDGSALNNNWPKVLEDRYFGFTPSLGDIDSDGELEIVLGTGYDVDTGKVYAWNTDGSPVSSNWPKLVSGYAFFSPISDIDPGYPGLEIITSIRYDNKVYAWHKDGRDVTGWPYVLEGDGGNSPAIGDVDDDGKLETAVGAYDSKVYVINSNGSNHTGWPINTGGILQISPAIGDIDKDGKTEIIQPADSQVYMWKETGKGIITWPMLQLNERHNGLYIARAIPQTGIYGTKFNDSNGNRIRDAGEEGLPNWTIRLVGFDASTRTVIRRTTTTDLNGNYSFAGLKPGLYTVSEKLKLDWMPTTLPSRIIHLSADQNVAVDFGNKKIR